MLQFDFERAKKLCKYVGVSSDLELRFYREKIVKGIYRALFFELIETENATEVPMSLIQKIDNVVTFFECSLSITQKGLSEVNYQIDKLLAKKSEIYKRLKKLENDRDYYIGKTKVRYADILAEIERLEQSRDSDLEYLSFLKLIRKIVKKDETKENEYYFECDFEILEQFFSSYIEKLRSTPFYGKKEYHDLLIEMAEVDTKIKELEKKRDKIFRDNKNFIFKLPSGKIIKIV